MVINIGKMSIVSWKWNRAAKRKHSSERDFVSWGGAWRGQERSWILHHPEDHQLFEDGQGWHTPEPPTCWLDLLYNSVGSDHIWARRYFTSSRTTMLTPTSQDTWGKTYISTMILLITCMENPDFLLSCLSGSLPKISKNRMLWYIYQ